MTVNDEEVAFTLFTVTENDPVEAPDGTTTVMIVVLHAITGALVPFSEIVLLPWLFPKFSPTIATADPTGPEPGEKLEIVGAWASARPEHTNTKASETTINACRFKRISVTSLALVSVGCRTLLIVSKKR